MKYSSLPFYSALSQDGRAKLHQNLTPFSFEKGQIIHAMDEGSYGMLYVEEGVISLSLPSTEQRKITLLRLRKGDVCFLTAPQTIPEITFALDVETETPAKILSLEDDVLTELMHDESLFAQYVYRALIKNYSDTVKAFRTVMSQRIEQRLASFLLKEAHHAGTLSISMTQDRIAAHIGSSREVVSRILKRFSKEGILTLSRGVVTIQNREALRKRTK